MSISSLLSQDYFLNRVIPNCNDLSSKRRLLLALELLRERYCFLIDLVNNNDCDLPNDLDLFTKELDKIDSVIEQVEIHLFD